MKKELKSILLVIFTLINLTWTICNKTRSNELREITYDIEDALILNTAVSDSLENVKRFLEMEEQRIYADTFYLKGNGILPGGKISVKAQGTGLRYVQQVFYIDSTKRKR